MRQELPWAGSYRTEVGIVTSCMVIAKTSTPKISVLLASPTQRTLVDASAGPLSSLVRARVVFSSSSCSRLSATYPCRQSSAASIIAARKFATDPINRQRRDGTASPPFSLMLCTLSLPIGLPYRSTGSVASHGTTDSARESLSRLQRTSNSGQYRRILV